jgi:uncharacterized protein
MKTSTLKFAMTTMNGMTYGLFSTLIIGVMIDQVGKLLGIGFLTNPIYFTLSTLMGAGIGLGIGLSLKLDGLKLVTAAIIGGIATSFRVTFSGGIQVANQLFKEGIVSSPVFNEPLTVYMVTISALLLMPLILRKKTPVDILLIPLTAVTLALLFTLLYSAPLQWTIDTIKQFIESATLYAPIPMSMIIALVMGLLLTSPLSSAAIAITIQLSGIAGGAAFIGTAVQMIGFAIQSRRDNGLGMVLSIGFGTSMLQFKNILKNPKIWIPTSLASTILAPFLIMLFETSSSPYGAGMGTSGLVGPLQTLQTMNYSLEAYLSVLSVLVVGGLLVLVIDGLMRKKEWIKDGDFAILNEI